MKIDVSNRILAGERIRLISKRNYDASDLVKASSQELVDLGVSKVFRKAIFESFPRTYTHRVYETDDLSILIYRWPSGELLGFPVVNSTAIIHYRQHQWLRFYPFCFPDQNNLFHIDTDQFEESSLSISRAYPFIGRDHWGHNLLDFFTQYCLIITTLSNPFQQDYLRDCNVIRLPMVQPSAGVERFMGNAFSPNSLYTLPNYSKNSIIRISGTSLVADAAPPLFALASFPKSSATPPQACGRAVKNRALYVQGLYDHARIADFYGFISGLVDIGVSLEHSLNIADENTAQYRYNDYDIIISLFGSTLLNPLYYSNVPIIALYPHWFFDGSLAATELDPLTDLVALFGTRLFPVLSDASHPNPSSSTGSKGFNHPCHYSIESIRQKIDMLASPKI